MLFATFDYLLYRLQRGRFSRRNRRSSMIGAIADELHPATIALLRPGDCIAIANYDWWVAWIIMYLSRCEFSHLAIYAGRGNVIHATLEGVALEPIEKLFGKKRRFVPWLIPPGLMKREFDENLINKYMGLPYSKRLIVAKAVRCLLGIDKRYFRVEFVLDVFLVAIASNWLLLGTAISGPFIWIAVCYLGLSLLFLSRRARYGGYQHGFEMPLDILNGLRLAGFRRIMDGDALLELFPEMGQLQIVPLNSRDDWNGIMTELGIPKPGLCGDHCSG